MHGLGRELAKGMPKPVLDALLAQIVGRNQSVSVINHACNEVLVLPGAAVLKRAPYRRDAQTKTSMTSKGAAKRHAAQALSGAERVYSGLRRAIMEHGLALGIPLPEEQVAARFNVSRTIVRAALDRLMAEGLVVRTKNRTARVANPTREDAVDVLDIRRHVEGIVVERLAGRLSARQLEELRVHVEREKAAHEQGSRDVAVRLSGEFHLMLAQSTGSSVLVRYVTELVSRFSLVLVAHGRPHSEACAVDEHLRVLDALATGDAETARKLMEQHLADVGRRALLPTQNRALSINEVSDELLGLASSGGGDRHPATMR